MKRLLMSRSFYGAILVGIIAGCFGIKAYNDNVYFHRLAGNSEAISAFDAWLYALGVGQSSLLKFIIVILIAIPFVDSYVYDKKTGYINYVRTRLSFNKYLFSKFLINGFAGGLIIFSIYIPLLIISGLLYPFNTPNTELNYIPYGFFEEIYMNTPFIYVFIVVLIGCIFGVLFATLGLTSSVLFNNRFAVTVYPFVFYVFFMIFAQIIHADFLLPIILITPFSIIGVDLYNILLGYLFVTIIVIVQMMILYNKEKSEVF